MIPQAKQPVYENDRFGSLSITSPLLVHSNRTVLWRGELTDNEWSAIKPMLPNKPRGVPRVNDRRVLNGIFWVLRSGAPWRDLPIAFGPYTTRYNRFVPGVERAYGPRL